MTTRMQTFSPWIVLQRVIAALLLPAALVPVVLFAVAIRLHGRGTWFIRQEREGLGGALFPFFKLRTMHSAPDDRSLPRTGRYRDEWERYGRIAADPRVVCRAARLARRYSVDELPQLINVVRGDMALVGPRPLPPDLAARLHEQDLRARRTVLPGLTGLWQISGRSDLDLETMGRLDSRYVAERSVRLDLLILLKTVPAVLLARGAY